MSEILNVLQEGHPMLETVCRPVSLSQIEDLKAKKIEERFRETCRALGWVGLAANQVGIPYRFFYADIPQVYGLVINPVIVSTHGVKSVNKEWCLSRKWMPDKKALRHHAVRVRFRTLDGGGWRDEFLKGFEAVVFQHEMDHLNGIVI